MMPRSMIALALVVGLLITCEAQAQTPAPQVSAPTSPMQAPKASAPAAPEFKLIIEPRAIDLLKATCARLATAKSMSFTAVLSYEFPSRLGPPLVYTVRNDVTMQRPDKLKIVTPGDGPASDLYYDGKTMVEYSPGPDLAAVAAAPPTIDEAMRAAYENAAIYYPFTDIILSDPYAALISGATLVFYIGKSEEVGGTETDMVAWADKDVFLQIWIGTKDKLPRRIRAIYRNDPLQLRHDMVLSNWQIDPVVPPGTFTSQKVLAAKRIPFANPGSEPSPVGTPLFITPPSGSAPAAAQPKP